MCCWCFDVVAGVSKWDQNDILFSLLTHGVVHAERVSTRSTIRSCTTEFFVLITLVAFHLKSSTFVWPYLYGLQTIITIAFSIHTVIAFASSNHLLATTPNNTCERVHCRESACRKKKIYLPMRTKRKYRRDQLLALTYSAKYRQKISVMFHSGQSLHFCRVS